MFIDLHIRFHQQLPGRNVDYNLRLPKPAGANSSGKGLK